MIAVLFAWGLLISAALPIGLYVLHVCEAGCFRRKSDRSIIAIWIGLLLLGNIYLAISLYGPIKPLIALIPALACTLLALIHKATRGELLDIISSLSGGKITFILILSVTIAIFSTQQVGWYDTGLYHHQMIEWLSNHGSVYGLGLIHFRFGFTSSWFALAAPFNSGILIGRAGAIMGGLTLLLVLSHACAICRYIFARQGVLTDCFVIICYLTCLPYTLAGSFMAVSPSPDFPIYILTIIVVGCILTLANSGIVGDASAYNDYLIPVVLSAGAITVKLSSAPLLIISALFYLANIRRSFNKPIGMILIIAALILPTMLVNLKTTGCPLFPSSFLCQSDMPWALRDQRATEVSSLIRSYNTVEGRGLYTNGVSQPINWILDKHTGSIRSEALLIILSVFSIALLAKDSSARRLKGLLWVASVAVAGIIFVLVTAPSLRFGLGYLCLLPGLAIAANVNRLAVFIPIIPISMVLLIPYTDLPQRPLRLILLMVIAGLYVVTLMIRRSHDLQWPILTYLFIAMLFPSLTIVKSVLHNVREFSLNKMSALLPPKIISPQQSELQVRKSTNFFYYVPVPSKLGNQCWAAPLPCTPSLTESDTGLRDEKIGPAGGFVRDLKRER